MWKSYSRESEEWSHLIRIAFTVDYQPVFRYKYTLVGIGAIDKKRRDISMSKKKRRGKLSWRSKKANHGTKPNKG